MTAEVRKAMAAAGARRAGRRFPAEARRTIVRYAQERIAAGCPKEAVARDVDLTAVTLSRWLVETPAFVPVAVTSPAAGPLVVRGPGGLVIEGLDLAGLAALLRELT